MTNLLPKRNRQKLLIEYTLRAFVMLLAFAVLALAVYALSLYVARNLAQSLNDEAHSHLSKTIEGEAVSLPDDPKRAPRVAYLVAHEKDALPSDVVERVTKLGGGTISIISISLEKEGGKYGVVIGGTALTRADLVTFQAAVRQEGYIQEPNIPLESFTKDKNPSFTLSGTISS